MYGAEKMGKGLSRKHATPSALNWVKNPQRRKIINGMRPVGCKDQFINLKMFLLNILFVRILRLLLWLLCDDAFSFSLFCALNRTTTFIF